jgi:hypothetical protein
MPAAKQKNQTGEAMKPLKPFPFTGIIPTTMAFAAGIEGPSFGNAVHCGSAK